MKALMQESLTGLMSELPEGVLSMAAGDFLANSDLDRDFKSVYADKPFEFSDRHNLVSAPALPDDTTLNEESKSNDN